MQFSDSEMVDYYCNLKGKFNSITRKCDCLMGFMGENCEEISCNGNGILLHEKCYCGKDFMGSLVQFFTIILKFCYFFIYFLSNLPYFFQFFGGNFFQ